jgi:multidrug efflux pump
LATAVAFGLTFATILTLIVTPCMLALGQRTSDGMTALRARLGGGRGIAPEAAE